jgi:hypothetical protein
MALSSCDARLIHQEDVFETLTLASVETLKFSSWLPHMLILPEASVQLDILLLVVCYRNDRSMANFLTRFVPYAPPKIASFLGSSSRVQQSSLPIVVRVPSFRVTKGFILVLGGLVLHLFPPLWTR